MPSPHPSYGGGAPGGGGGGRPQLSNPIDPLQNSPDTCLTVFDIGLGWWMRLGAGRPPRSQADKFAGTAIDEAQGDIGEADEPVTVGTLADGDGLTGDRFGHEEQAAAPLDLAARAHAPDLLARTIIDIADRLY